MKRELKFEWSATGICWPDKEYRLVTWWSPNMTYSYSVEQLIEGLYYPIASDTKLLTDITAKLDAEETYFKLKAKGVID